MKVLLVALVLLLACLSLSASAETLSSAITSGLTSVTYTTSTIGGLVWYDFTLTNNTDNANPLVDLDGQSYVVLVDKLSLFTGVAAVDYATPNSDWTFSQQNGFERYSDTPNKKYYAPPSVAPLGSISGFKLAFNEGFVLPDEYALTHVLGVVPNLSTVEPVKYSATNVKFDTTTGSVYSGGTWYDKPGEKIPPDNTVPEFSSVLLGVIGFLGAGGLSRLRRRA